MRVTMRALAALLLLVCAAAIAQSTYPARPITLVVPYPPGGSNDVFARRLAKGLGEALGQTVIIDNKPGAAGNIGTAFVAKAAPDGYTLAAISSSMTSNAAVQANLPFDPVKSFAPVAQIAKGPFIVAVNQEFPARTPAEFLAVVKRHPGKFNYASSGTGSSNQFATEAFKVLTGTFIVHVPYRGMGPAVTDLAGNQIQILFASGPSLLPQIRSGKLRAIGITSLTPSPIAPELTPMSTVAPGYQFELWWGVLAPAGTPADIVGKLNAAINRVTASAEMKQFFLNEGAEPAPLTQPEFAAVIARDVPRWRALARQQSITAE